jgi:hypothetical protein
MAKDRIEKHIKLTLKTRYHADVIAILDGIEPSKVAGTVIEALRVWKRGKQGHTHCEPIQTPAPVATTPAAPSVASRSKVNLSTGFDALDG